MKAATYTVPVTGMHCGSRGLVIDETMEHTAGLYPSHTSVRAGRAVALDDPAVIGSLGCTANATRPDLMKDR